MSPIGLFSLAVAAASFFPAVIAQTSTCQFTLIDATYAYSDLPYQIDDCVDGRGPQTGYNECNATTQNQNSLCQTIFFDNLADFCIWGPPDPNTTIADSEGVEVAWCTKSGHGTRLIPEGALTGAQILISPNYMQIVGFIDQTMINIAGGDQGGELDGRGQDDRGNPMGGACYTNYYSGNNDTYDQIFNWGWFVGSNTFCAKICPGSADNTTQYAYCDNIYDEVGCNYNMPNAAQNGTFEVCDADDSTPVGIYTSDGVSVTWTQGYTGFATIPYTPTPPASSNCRTYQSTDLFTDLLSITASSSTTAATATTTPTGTAGVPSGTVESGSGASMPSATGKSGASSLHVPAAAGIVGAAFALIAVV